MPVHVSIHDVSPLWRLEVEDALDLCSAAGATAALLVVPDYHGRSPLLEDTSFCARLRELQHAAHEIYLHGFNHRTEPRPPRLSLRERARWTLAQRVASAGEAELADLPEDEGRARLAAGERVLTAAGLRVDGYVAPAWVMPRWLLPALAQRGCRYTEDHLRAYDPLAGTWRTSVVVNWASRSWVRLLSTVAWSRAARVTRRLVPVRIAIHPADMRVALLRREVRAALAWARGDFVPRGAALLEPPHAPQ
jgi:predicted deacetylase